MIRKELKKLGESQQICDKDWGVKEEYMRCRAGRSAFWVSWEGYMTACGMLPFPLQTDTFSEPFRDCWIRLTDTVRTAPGLGECSQCGKREICKPCVAMLYAETGEVNRRAPYLCRFSDCLITEMKKEMNEG